MHHVARTVYFYLFYTFLFTGSSIQGRFYLGLDLALYFDAT